MSRVRASDSPETDQQKTEAQHRDNLSRENPSYSLCHVLMSFSIGFAGALLDAEGKKLWRVDHYGLAEPVETRPQTARIEAQVDCDVRGAIEELLIASIRARSVSKERPRIELGIDLVACAEALEARCLEVLVVELLVDQ
jgi:hypothetical protein